ncbi:threonine--tRNA ligase [Iodobacter arcticus]|uniref:Threonine--tRNA ligase n=1 Tax=Iodobacter arcticus TaxID=590593 RepID=A0ABW2R373_9NEIS
MPHITLPDGRQRSYDKPVSVNQIAHDISPNLAKVALAALVNEALVDTQSLVEVDATVKIITNRDAEGLTILRHSCAHLLAMAVKSLYPSAQATIGPVIEDGFYYDFAFERSFTPDDLIQIEQRMYELAKANLAVTRRTLNHEAAIKFFESIGETYKAELIHSIPTDETLTLYKQGDFEDLCRGPHVPNMGIIQSFKLMRVAGAYWRGDAKNAMLQRIYGTCWPDQKTLKSHLHHLEEVAKRDHRKLGVQLDLFHFDECAPGAVFWHPKGWTLFQQLIGFMREQQDEAGYVEVNTPDVMDRSLWERSGHWMNYRDHMFTITTEDERIFALKPMNCPGALALYAHGLRSYRELPLRMAEFGKVHRYEPSGALHGLMRVRHFTQDDAHIFCTNQQMQDECSKTISLIFNIYRQFGFENIIVKLSTRPENRIGSDENWDLLEDALHGALASLGIGYQINSGEGAFYGPKLEFVLCDAIGRHWQCGTLQVDLNLPERFDISFINEHNERERPVMLHRALFGSLERFIGILIEHYSGILPLWLAPIQLAIMSISEAQSEYAKTVCQQMKRAGFRVQLDVRNEKIGFKIREHTLQKIPYLIVVGDREQAESLLTIRSQSGENLGTFTQPEAIELLRANCNPLTPDLEASLR